MPATEWVVPNTSDIMVPAIGNGRPFNLGPNRALAPYDFPRCCPRAARPLLVGVPSSPCSLSPLLGPRYIPSSLALYRSLTITPPIRYLLRSSP
jgi:hypothetical protein